MNFRQNRRTMDRRIVHREHWNNLLVEIIDNGDTRSLFFGGDVLQSSMSLSHPNRLTLSYTHCMMASLLINDHPERVLVIGVGAGSLVRFLHSHLPTCRIDGIDNAPHIIKLAHGYFSLPEDERLTLFDRDGFDYLQQLPEPRGYDLILVDAFDGAGMAASIYHRACFDLCRHHLRRGGVISINLWSGDGVKMDEVQNDCAGCFGPPLTLPVPNRGNVVCLAGRQADLNLVMRRNRAELDRLSDRFAIDFRRIAGICRKHNLTRWQRLSRLFS
jgi:spermidine synthase